MVLSQRTDDVVAGVDLERANRTRQRKGRRHGGTDCGQSKAAALVPGLVGLHVKPPYFWSHDRF